MILFQPNLLPEDRLRDARYRIWTLVCFRLGLVMLGVIVVAGIALLPSYFLARLQEREIMRQVSIMEKGNLDADFQAVDERVSRLAKQIRVLKGALAAGDSVSGRLEALFAGMPEGIRLTQVAYEVEKRAVAISGTGETRGSVVNFQSFLREKQFVETVDSPIANILEERNPKFRIQLQLK